MPKYLSASLSEVNFCIKQKASVEFSKQAAYKYTAVPFAAEIASFVGSSTQPGVTTPGCVEHVKRIFTLIWTGQSQIKSKTLYCHELYLF